MLFGKHINRYYLKYAHWLILGLLSLVMVDFLQLEIPKFYRMVIDGMSYGYITENGAQIPFTMDLSVEDTVLPAGQYRLRYTIKDMLDRTYYTEFFDLTWDGQNAVFTDPYAEPAE